jgi:hypothetical protein
VKSPFDRETFEYPTLREPQVVRCRRPPFFGFFSNLFLRESLMCRAAALPGRPYLRDRTDDEEQKIETCPRISQKPTPKKITKIKKSACVSRDYCFFAHNKSNRVRCFVLF